MVLELSLKKCNLHFKTVTLTEKLTLVYTNLFKVKWLNGYMNKMAAVYREKYCFGYETLKRYFHFIETRVT